MKRGAKGKHEKWLTPEGLQLVAGWKRDGLTDAQICKNMGICTSTMCLWKDKHKAFAEAMAQGKENADFIVENALMRSACGYDVWEEKETWDGEQWVPAERKKRHIPANPTAAAFWLKNRKPEMWREKPEVAVAITSAPDGLTEVLKAAAGNISGAAYDDSDMLPQGGD